MMGRIRDRVRLLLGFKIAPAAERSVGSCDSVTAWGFRELGPPVDDPGAALLEMEAELLRVCREIYGRP
jgi:hypothetical protein